MGRRNLEAKCSELDERTAQLHDLCAQQQEQPNGNPSASTLQNDVLVQRLAESQAAIEAALAAKELAEANEEGYLNRIAALEQQIAYLAPASALQNDVLVQRLAESQAAIEAASAAKELA